MIVRLVLKRRYLTWKQRRSDHYWLPCGNGCSPGIQMVDPQFTEGVVMTRSWRVIDYRRRIADRWKVALCNLDMLSYFRRMQPFNLRNNKTCHWIREWKFSCSVLCSNFYSPFGPFPRVVSVTLIVYPVTIKRKMKRLGMSRSPQSYRLLLLVFLLLFSG